MKRLPFLALLLLTCAAAQAETITLGVQDCGIIDQCRNVPNDVGANVAYLSYNSGYRQVELILDGVTYFAKPVPAPPFVSLPLFAADGTSVLFSANYSTYRTCNRSGHNFCSTHWVLQGGSIAR